MRATTRPVVRVPGAERLVATARAQVESSAAPRQLAQWLASGAGGLDLAEAHAAAVASERSVLLTEPGDGLALALRWFAPGQPTTIHDHTAWGALVVLSGRDQYERWEHDGVGGVRLAATHFLTEGDALWWNAPPEDLHRQRGLDEGALELLLLGSLPDDDQITTYAEPAPADQVANGLAEAFRVAYLGRNVEPLAPWYADDVHADVFLPRWRSQRHGKRNLLAELGRLEFGLPGQRLTRFRSVATSDGMLIEVEVRSPGVGGERLWQAMHHVRVRVDRIVEHVIYCTGFQSPEVIEQQADNAWLRQP